MNARVLVIEDNDDNMELTCFILNAEGYDTIRADTGRAGCAAALQQLPDFIVLDIQLPDMNGLDVVNTIRGAEQTRHIPVIAMTSYAMSGDRERMLGAGCNGYIEKPIDPDTVVSQMQKFIAEAGI